MYFGKGFKDKKKRIFKVEINICRYDSSRVPVYTLRYILSAEKRILKKYFPVFPLHTPQFYRRGMQGKWPPFAAPGQRMDFKLDRNTGMNT